VYGLLSYGAHKNFLNASVSTPTLMAFDSFSSVTSGACKFVSTTWNPNSRRNVDSASEDLLGKFQIAVDVLFKDSWKRLMLSHKHRFVARTRAPVPSSSISGM
jgi:hypothetical protein